LTPEDSAPLLAALETIEPVPPGEWEFLRTKLRSKHLEKGEFFLRPGFEALQIGFLVKGLIRYYYVADGHEFIKHFCFDGHFVSSYASLAAGTSSDYWIEALEPTDLIVFAYQDWLSLLRRHPVWGVVNARVQAEALVLAEKRERSLILDSAKTRYLNLLAEVPGIEGRVRQYDLARYLGITPVALSRIRGRPLKN
jgi:CRP-like cAMP-binding protein